MIACVVTVYNEEDTIVPLLEALVGQIKRIDEIIIVDAFSKDATYKYVKNFIEERKKKNIFLYRKKGNRSKGRNYGIKMAKSKTILVTDAGCIPDKNWSKYLSNCFRKNVDVVSGFYYSGAKTPFTKSLSTYTCVMEDRIDVKNYLPSSRSIAFKKEAWEKVNGYPEHLDTCEDLVFARELRKKGFRFVFEKKAFVIWPQQKNIISAFVQFYNYARGDGQALYIRQQTPLLYGRYIIGLLLLGMALYYKSFWLFIFLIVAFIGYLMWAIAKNNKYIKSNLKYFYLPLLQVASDIAVLSGMIVGFVNRK